MKKWIVVIVITVMFGWAVYDMFGKEETKQRETGTRMVAEGSETMNPQTGIEEGKMAPDFTLQRLNGETVSLSDYKGKKILINFWATWCPPCRAEMPDMEKFYNNNEVEVLAVNLTETERVPGDVKKFVKEFGLTFPILMDKESEVMAKYKVGPVPTSVFIDEEGKVQSVIVGAMNYDIMMQRYEDL